MNGSGKQSAVGAVVFVIFAIIYGIISANIPDSKAIDAAKTAGYTDIHVESSTIWFVEVRGCSDSDEKRWVVSATNPHGDQVEFYVCGGVLKGGTIRSK